MRKLVPWVIVFVCATAHAEKKRKTAFALSAAGTGVSSALVLSSFLVSNNAHPFNEPLLYIGLGTSVFTPSLGHFYAYDFFTPGLIVRAGAAGLAAYAVQQQDSTQCDTATSAGQTCKSINQTGIVLLGLAAIAYIGATSYDVRDAPDAADRYNKRRILFTPTAGPPGLSLVGTF